MKYIYDPQMYYTPTESFVQQGWTWGDMIAVVYITGVLIGIGRMGLQMAYLGNLLRGKSQKKNVNKSAFSFFNFLFVSKDMPMRDVIMRHEQVHIRQLHSADIMLFELLAIFNWFNPIIYLYKKQFAISMSLLLMKSQVNGRNLRRNMRCCCFTSNLVCKPYR
jgi:hypothetical protein